jgi:hypothetical protein
MIYVSDIINVANERLMLSPPIISITSTINLMAVEYSFLSVKPTKRI